MNLDCLNNGIARQQKTSDANVVHPESDLVHINARKYKSSIFGKCTELSLGTESNAL